MALLLPVTALLLLLTALLLPTVSSVSKLATWVADAEACMLSVMLAVAAVELGSRAISAAAVVPLLRAVTVAGMPLLLPLLSKAGCMLWMLSNVLWISSIESDSHFGRQAWLHCTSWHLISTLPV
jgi:membrane-bound metal-dependent hydrolase YbcI (DUF457 family)